MIETYGYSAEVRDFMWIRSMLGKNVNSLTFLIVRCSEAFINPLWSWTNGSEHLRMYLKGEKELSFFKLKWVKKDENN